MPLPDDPDETIARLWDELADFDAGRTADAQRHLMATLCQLLDAKNVAWVGAVRAGPGAGDPLRGWRIGNVGYLHDAALNLEAVKELKKRWEKRETDPLSLYSVRETGTFRAFSLRKAMTAEWFESAYYRLLYASRGIHDAIMVMFPLNEDAQSTFFFHGAQSRGAFGDVEIALAARALRGIKWFHRRLMLDHGLLVASGPLSPAERKVSQLLLTEASEKEIAQQLGLAVSTVHQYVTSIYRKFGVNGRAGLMSLWLNRAG